MTVRINLYASQGRQFSSIGPALGFQRKVVAERLGIVPDEIDGGHLPALGRPHELVQRLEAYRGKER